MLADCQGGDVEFCPEDSFRMMALRKYDNIALAQGQFVNLSLPWAISEGHTRK